MSTTDSVLLILLSVLMSILLVSSIVLTVIVIKLVGTVRRVAEKAEGVVDSVESAAEVFKDTQGKLAIIKVISNIVKMAQRSRK